ncbi:MAG TPA: DNA repair protein RadC [Syntrophorhabdaceae bacterium]|nr:DNA repair protein RadC [Syntrophorhabdaceae bacterium]
MKNRSYTVLDMPRSERPRERLQRLGAEVLSAQELLAIIIGRGIAGKSVMTIAQELITTFGSIKAISEASIEELSKIKGLGNAKAVQLKACFELGRRKEIETEYAYKDLEMSNPKAVADLLRHSIKDKNKEHFLLITLNTRNKVLGINHISTGTLNASLVHPREVFKEAIACCASSVIIAHNHPSGDPEPSQEDINITRRLIDAGKILGIEVLDHVIIGRGTAKSAMADKHVDRKEDYCSLKEKGLI